jgi:hypothetical protein
MALPHTLLPTFRARSRSTRSTLCPAFATGVAALEPAGPAPIIATSTLLEAIRIIVTEDYQRRRRGSIRPKRRDRRAALTGDAEAGP